jgi:hypothetical protein
VTGSEEATGRAAPGGRRGWRGECFRREAEGDCEKRVNGVGLAQKIC